MLQIVVAVEVPLPNLQHQFSTRITIMPKYEKWRN